MNKVDSKQLTCSFDELRQHVHSLASFDQFQDYTCCLFVTKFTTPVQGWNFFPYNNDASSSTWVINLLLENCKISNSLGVYITVPNMYKDFDVFEFF